ncbi:MAG: radical SAM family heme chaperone HemW [Bacteroidales bacterium]|nr:radical SAM family heme chaperone HemW [Bacteroidales bacterium]MCF8403180.1 radical SAM family heme chaperone HemW [Bacteroidales bacterium]
MAGIYIHIPFCKQKCHYCNFYSLASKRNKPQFLDALEKEIVLQKDYLNGEKIETIYFGGGTPSLLSAVEIIRLLDLIHQHYIMGQDAEITLEANPDDLNAGYVRNLRDTKINRLSIGIQSFHDKDLKYLHRVHDSAHALNAIKRVQDNGFKNVSIDLIYGIPTLSNEAWEKNLAFFQSLNLSHLSAYSLTVEPKTALDILIKRNKMRPVEDYLAVRHFRILMDFAKLSGLEHYEISNFCLNGQYSKHNVSYWQGKKYLGLGPSAHSFNLFSRQWNRGHLAGYISSLQQDKIPAEKEKLSIDQKYNEYVMVSLRTSWGTDVDYIAEKFGCTYKDHFIYNVQRHIDSEHLIETGGIYTLSDEGKLFTDRITSELFL